jgi:asparagine synthase (glutamine-hydrolysing)
MALAMGLPVQEKLGSLQEKPLLERLVQRQIPHLSYSPSVMTTPGFLNPWLHDPMVHRLFETLHQGTLVGAGWISRRWLKQALAGNLKPPITFKQLLALLSLEVWFKLYIDTPVTSRKEPLSVFQLLQRS